MTSQDGKSNNRTAPNDPFKRAVTTPVRAIAQGRDLSVTFGGDRPGQSGNTVRLPEPPRAMTKHDAAVTRGYADALALRIACHDPAVHRKNHDRIRHRRHLLKRCHHRHAKLGCHAFDEPRHASGAQRPIGRTAGIRGDNACAGHVVRMRRIVQQRRIFHAMARIQANQADFQRFVHFMTGPT